MKKTKRFIVLVSAFLIMVAANLLNADAAANPYPSSQTINGVKTVPCTWYAWQQAYDKTGVVMPNFGNAKNWYSSAKNKGYSVGTVPKAKSIAVWTNSGYGHVGYVVSVSGSTMKVNEGGMYNTNGSAMNGNGIINGSTCNSAVGSKKSSYSSSTLVGFIYLTEGVSLDVKVSTHTSKNTISDTNAILYGKVDKPTGVSVNKIGIKVWKDGTSENDGYSKFDTPSSSYSSSTYMHPYYNMNDELNVKLIHATKYWYKIYAKVDGKEYWSSASSFTTKGTHTYGEWKTKTVAQCESTGTKIRSCSCGKSESSTINALGHSYSNSWIVDKNPTCTTAGSKSYHCIRCSSKKSVTKIDALGHSYGEWVVSKNAACTANGTKIKKCSCGATISDIIKSSGHKWGDWKIEKTATTDSEGKSARKCTSCALVETTTIPKLPEKNHKHEFGKFETEKAPSCTEGGTAVSKCKTCDTKRTKTISVTAHSFSEWNCIKEATTTELGEYERVCNDCNYKETKQTDILANGIENIDVSVVETEEMDVPISETNEVENDEIKNLDNERKEFPYTVIILCAILVLGIGVLLLFILKKNKN